MAEASTDAQSTREEILAVLKDAMDDLSGAITDVEPDSLAEEKLQLRRYHELGYLANQYRKLQKDTDVEEMESELELLQEAMDLRRDGS